MQLTDLWEVPPQLRAGLWIAWYRGHAVSAHADCGVLMDLMAAEGLTDFVWYTHADDDTRVAVPAEAAD